MPAVSTTPTSAAPELVRTPDNLHVGRQSYQTLDAWRGLASLWVVAYHAGLSVPALVAARSTGLVALSFCGYLGVPVFFVISGYCIASAALSAARGERPAARFFRARVRRIYPPYLAALLLTLLAALASSLGGGRSGGSLVLVNPLHMHFLTYFAALTLTQVPLHQPLVQAVFWTLNYEAAFYVLVGLLLLLPRIRQTPRRLLNALHGLTLAATGLLVVCPQAPPFPLDFWAQFGLGILAFDILRHPQARWPRWALLGVTLGLLAFAATHDYGNRFVAYNPPVRIGFLTSLGVAFLLLLFAPWDKPVERLRPVRLLSHLGGFSYSFYLIHPLAIGAMRLLWRHGALPMGTGTGFAAAEVAASLVCAWLFYLGVEKRCLGPARRLPSGGAAPAAPEGPQVPL